ncbi:hypothetical protein B0O99DRAFT_624811 [Bisporella sp. PMI_857]|nr:hypothetical protein B0O99DRAFT_624811 [Bisporella sp. PMI_857]
MAAIPPKTLALFGATGGCCSALLKVALEAGYTVNALVRTPAKLAALSEKHPNLHLIQGDIASLPAIRDTLISNGRVVDIVVSGLGMVMKRQGLKFTSDQPHICEEATKAIFDVLAAIEKEKTVQVPAGGPVFVLLSTTGISEHGRDIPIAMIPLYHWMLPVPHEDKKKMEALAITSGRRYVLIRPSLLMDGKAKGVSALRVGAELPGQKGDATSTIGYTISREDVGAWIFGECVKGNSQKWEGKIVALTY